MHCIPSLYEQNSYVEIGHATIVAQLRCISQGQQKNFLGGQAKNNIMIKILYGCCAVV